VEETSETIFRAITMSEEERRSRHQFCFEYVTTYTAARWADLFLDSLKNSVSETEAIKTSVPPVLNLAQIEFSDWEAANKRLLVLDLMDCLIGPLTASGEPVITGFERAKLSPSVQNSINALLSARQETVILILTPHKREILDALFTRGRRGFSPLILVAENGCVFKSFAAETDSPKWTRVTESEQQQTCFDSPEWRQTLRKLLEFLQERTPGSFIEESQFSFKWFTRGELANSSSTLRELLLQRWAGPLAETAAEIVLADRYVEIRAKEAASLTGNFAKIVSHSDLVNLLRDPADTVVTVGAFPYRDDEMFAAVEERLSTYWAHHCAVSRGFSATKTRKFYSVSVSHAKISKANFSLPSKYHVAQLLAGLASRDARIHGA
jgi:trehalose 6-phosphate synthase/phosphatase